MQERRKFTLIEMLTVIAISMILAGLLFPALSGAHRKSERVMCGGNLRQLALAMTMYGQSNRWRLPPYVRNSVLEHGGVNWARYIRPYYGDVRVLACPCSAKPAPPDTEEGLHLYDGNYGWNYDGTQGSRGQLYSLIPNPSKGYLLFDSGDQCVTYGENTWENLMEELDLDWDSKAEGANRHGDAVNVIMVDGHMELRQLRDFIAAPCVSNRAPWYVEWLGGRLDMGTVPYPGRN